MSFTREQKIFLSQMLMANINEEDNSGPDYVAIAGVMDEWYSDYRIKARNQTTVALDCIGNHFEPYNEWLANILM